MQTFLQTLLSIERSLSKSPNIGTNYPKLGISNISDENVEVLGGRDYVYIPHAPAMTDAQHTLLPFSLLSGKQRFISGWLLSHNISSLVN